MTKSETARRDPCRDLMTPFKDETGNVYGRLTVLQRLPSLGGGALWLCQCSCGAKLKVRGNTLRSGHVTECKYCSGEWERP